MSLPDARPVKYRLLALRLLEFSDVRFRGQSGHRVKALQCPHMTQSGLGELRHALMSARFGAIEMTVRSSCRATRRASRTGSRGQKACRPRSSTRLVGGQCRLGGSQVKARLAEWARDWQAHLPISPSSSPMKRRNGVKSFLGPGGVISARARHLTSVGYTKRFL